MIRDPEVQRVLRPLRGDLLLDMIVLPGILVLDIRQPDLTKSYQTHTFSLW